jgi:hypothetical protein
MDRGMAEEQKVAYKPLSRWQKVQQQLWFKGCVVSSFALIIGTFGFLQLPPHPARLQHVEGFVREATKNKGSWVLELTNGRIYQGIVYAQIKDGRNLIGKFIEADVWHGRAFRLRSSDAELLKYDDVYASRWKWTQIYLIAALIGFAFSAASASARLRRFLMWVPRPSAKTS